MTDAEWALVAPYLTLLDEDALQRRSSLREVFNALRWMVRAGAPWRLLPTNFPPWPTVYQQARRWVAAGCFEALVHDQRLLLRLALGRAGQPAAAHFDAWVLQSRPESGARAGYTGHKRRKGSKIHQALDTLGSVLALTVSPANEDERTQVAALAAKAQAVTGEHVGWRGSTRATPAPQPPRRLRPRASNPRWYVCPRPSGASCCCRAVGLPSGVSRGSRASADWCAMTSGCPPCSRGGTSSPSSASCSTR